MPGIGIDPHGSPVTLRLIPDNSEVRLAAVVWRYGPGKEPLGQAGELHPGQLEIILGDAADVADDLFLVQGEVLRNGANRRYSLSLSLQQGGRELVAVVPSQGGSGEVGPAGARFQHSLQLIPASAANGNGAATHEQPTRLRTLVWLHGMGDSDTGFSRSLVSKLTSSGTGNPDTAAIQHREIVYEPLNQEIAKKIRNVDLNIANLLAHSGGWILEQVNVGGNVDLTAFEKAARSAIGDVGGMVMSTGARRMVLMHIISELLRVVEDADRLVDRSQHTIDIVCHSLGTFVAYELLHYIAATDAGRQLRPANRVQIRNVFMLAPVLALIRDSTVFNLIPSESDLATKRRPFVTPVVPNPWDGPTDVGQRFHAFRHAWDPFASIRVTEGPFLVHPPHVFDQWHAGPNMHSYSNYVTQYHSTILTEVLK